MNVWGRTLIPLLASVCMLGGCTTASDSPELEQAVSVVQEIYPGLLHDEAVAMLGNVCDIAEAAEGSSDQLALALAYFAVEAKKSTDQVFRLARAAVKAQCPQYESLTL